MNTISGSRVKPFDTARQLYHSNIQWPSREASTDQQSSTDFVLKIQEAHKDTGNTTDYLCRVTDLFCNTIFVCVCLVILIIVPGAMVSMGVKFLSDCPVQPKIPVYLLVWGCFGVLKIVGMLWKNVQMRRYETMDAFYDAQDNDAAFASHTFKLMDAMLSAFLLIWQIIGSFWVFSIWEPNYTQLLHEPSNWCEKTVYMLAVLQILTCYALLGLGFVVLFIVGIYYKCSLKYDR